MSDVNLEFFFSVPLLVLKLFFAAEIDYRRAQFVWCRLPVQWGKEGQKGWGSNS